MKVGPNELQVCGAHQRPFRAACCVSVLVAQDMQQFVGHQVGDYESILQWQGHDGRFQHTCIVVIAQPGAGAISSCCPNENVGTIR